MALDELRLIEEQIRQLYQELAHLLAGHQHAVQRLAAVPGLGVDSAQQIIAEVAGKRKYPNRVNSDAFAPVPNDPNRTQ